MRKLGADWQEAIQVYEEQTRNEIADAAIRDVPESERLSFQEKVLRSALEECEELSSSDRQPEHLILAGVEFDGDGENNWQAALSRYRELIAKGINPSKIAIKRGWRRSHLVRYLGLLPNASLKSITYFGHGMGHGLVMGPKELLLPPTWSPELKISYDEWVKRNQSIVYDETLDELSYDLRRVVARGAPIELYSCHAAESIGPRLKSILPSSPVTACFDAMHFEYRSDEKSEWMLDWSGPVPMNSRHVRMVGDGQPMQKVSPTQLPADWPKDRKPRVKQSGGGGAVLGDPSTDALNAISFRLIYGSGNEAKVEDGKRIVVFSRGDRERMRQLLGDLLANKKLGRFDWNELERRVNERTKDAQDRSTWYEMLDRLKLCVNESVRLYYPER